MVTIWILVFLHLYLQQASNIHTTIGCTSSNILGARLYVQRYTIARVGGKDFWCLCYKIFVHNVAVTYVRTTMFGWKQAVLTLKFCSLTPHTGTLPLHSHFSSCRMSFPPSPNDWWNISDHWKATYFAKFSAFHAVSNKSNKAMHEMMPKENTCLMHLFY